MQPPLLPMQQRCHPLPGCALFPLHCLSCPHAPIIMPPLSPTPGLRPVPVRRRMRMWGLPRILQRHTHAAAACARLRCWRPAGQTASLLSKYRPPQPILTLVIPTLKSDGFKWHLVGRGVARQCQLQRGLLPVLAAPSPSGARPLTPSERTSLADPISQRAPLVPCPCLQAACRSQQHACAQLGPLCMYESVGAQRGEMLRCLVGEMCGALQSRSACCPWCFCRLPAI